MGEEEFEKLSNEDQEKVLKILNNICEEITIKTGMAGGIYLKKTAQLERELESFEYLIRKDNNRELEDKLSSILDQFIDILKDLKEEQKK